MFVIAVYDISTLDAAGRRRLPKVMKVMRRFLHHSQKSVFEGEITEAKLLSLKIQIENLIDKNEDYVVFFKIQGLRGLDRVNVGREYDPTSNII